jgi:hypothetical protein
MKTVDDYDLLPISKFVKGYWLATLYGRRYASRKSMRNGFSGSLTHSENVRLQDLDPFFGNKTRNLLLLVASLRCVSNGTERYEMISCP